MSRHLSWSMLTRVSVGSIFEGLFSVQTDHNNAGSCKRPFQVKNNLPSDIFNSRLEYRLDRYDREIVEIPRVTEILMTSASESVRSRSDSAISTSHWMIKESCCSFGVGVSLVMLIINSYNKQLIYNHQQSCSMFTITIFIHVVYSPCESPQNIIDIGNPWIIAMSLLLLLLSWQQRLPYVIYS